jgi:hypothetical protein
LVSRLGYLTQVSSKANREAGETGSVIGFSGPYKPNAWATAGQLSHSRAEDRFMRFTHHDPH